MKKKSLYDILGVTIDATDDEIKDAFRGKAKDAHPDKESGDLEEMQTLNRAYAVLKNHSAREQYDRFGDEAGTVNNDSAVVARVVTEIADQILNTNPPVIIEFVNRIRNEWENNFSAGIRKIENDVKRLIKFKARIVRKPDGPEFVVTSIDNKIRALEDQMLTIRKDYALRQQALAVFELYTFTDEQEPMFMRMSGTMTY